MTEKNQIKKTDLSDISKETLNINVLSKKKYSLSNTNVCKQTKTKFYLNNNGLKQNIVNKYVKQVSGFLDNGINSIPPILNKNESRLGVLNRFLSHSITNYNFYRSASPKSSQIYTPRSFNLTPDLYLGFFNKVINSEKDKDKDKENSVCLRSQSSQTNIDNKNFKHIKLNLLNMKGKNKIQYILFRGESNFGKGKWNMYDSYFLNSFQTVSTSKNKTEEIFNVKTLLYNLLLEQKKIVLSNKYVFTPNKFVKPIGLWTESEILDYKSKEILNMQKDKNLFINKPINGIFTNKKVNFISLLQTTTSFLFDKDNITGLDKQKFIWQKNTNKELGLKINSPISNELKRLNEFNPYISILPSLNYKPNITITKNNNNNSITKLNQTTVFDTPNSSVNSFGYLPFQKEVSNLLKQINKRRLENQHNHKNYFHRGLFLTDKLFQNIWESKKELKKRIKQQLKNKSINKKKVPVAYPDVEIRIKAGSKLIDTINSPKISLKDNNIVVTKHKIALENKSKELSLQTKINNIIFVREQNNDNKNNDNNQQQQNLFYGSLSNNRNFSYYEYLKNLFMFNFFANNSPVLFKQKDVFANANEGVSLPNKHFNKEKKYLNYLLSIPTTSYSSLLCKQNVYVKESNNTTTENIDSCYNLYSFLMQMYLEMVILNQFKNINNFTGRNKNTLNKLNDVFIKRKNLLSSSNVPLVFDKQSSRKTFANKIDFFLMGHLIDKLIDNTKRFKLLMRIKKANSNFKDFMITHTNTSDFVKPINSTIITNPQEKVNKEKYSNMISDFILNLQTNLEIEREKFKSRYRLPPHILILNIKKRLSLKELRKNKKLNKKKQQEKFSNKPLLLPTSPIFSRSDSFNKIPFYGYKKSYKGNTLVNKVFGQWESTRFMLDIYKILSASFKSMYSLISYPTFVITPNKVKIKLFYFILLPLFLKWKFKKFNTFNTPSPSNIVSLPNKQIQLKSFVSSPSLSLKDNLIKLEPNQRKNSLFENKKENKINLKHVFEQAARILSQQQQLNVTNVVSLSPVNKQHNQNSDLFNFYSYLDSLLQKKSFIYKDKQNNSIPEWQLNLIKSTYKMNSFGEENRTKNKYGILNDKRKFVKTYNNFKKHKLKIRKKFLLLTKLNLVKIYPKMFNRLCQIFSYFFQKPVEFDLIRLHYPYNNANILAQLLGIMINKLKVKMLLREMLSKTLFKKYDGSGTQINYFNNSTDKENILPAFISGINFRVAGRLANRRIIPRKTKIRRKKGAYAAWKVNYLDFARYVNKNKRGAFSITLKIGQSYHKTH